MGEPRYPSSAFPRNLEQTDFWAVSKISASLIHTETQMNTHKDFAAGNELHLLSIIGYLGMIVLLTE